MFLSNRVAGQVLRAGRAEQNLARLGDGDESGLPSGNGKKMTI